MKTVWIKQATKQGFIECVVGGLQTYLTPPAKPAEVVFRRAV